MKHAQPAATRPAGLTRRNFMQASAAVGTGVGMLPAGHAAGNSLEGYVGAASVAVGGTLDFFLRDPQALGTGVTPYPVTFTRIGAPDVFMFNTTVDIGNQVVPADASTNGCRWARSYRLTVPGNWPTGVYYAYVGSGENATTVPFIVRPVGPTPGVKALVAIPITTVHAYNEYGGKSLYDYNSSGGVRAPKVSLDRPLTQTFNSFYDTYAQYLVRWLAKNNLAVDYCTDIDIEANPALLNPYQLYMQAGHDEYWTLERRRTMDAYVASGRNAAYLAGNTAWFRIRLESGNGVANRTVVCYKDAATDPVTDPALKTINFFALPTPYPENITTGLGFRKGCSWASALPRPITPTVVQRAEHWAFAGTGLARGTGFGGAYVGYEADAADFTLGAADQRPYATGADGSPDTLRILGIADASTWDAQSIALGGGGELSGYAMIAVFSRGGTAGTVFNAGSTDWAYGLRPEIDGQAPTPISRITRNVFDKLTAAWTETADVRQYSSVVGGLLNCYYSTGTLAPSGSGMAVDGWVFRGYPVAVSGSIPVYRYRTNGTNLAQRLYFLRTESTAPTGLVADGVAFHAYASARSDAVPIYEHYAFNGLLQMWVGFCSPLATPPAGFTAGPVRFYAPNVEGMAPSAPPPTPSFTLTPASGTLSLTAGQSRSVAVTVNRVNGFSGSVTFGVSGLPAGATASFSPASSNSGSTLTLNTTANTTPAGSYQIMVTGSAPGTPPAMATVTLVVTAAPQPGFTLSASPSTISLVAGQARSTAVTVNKINGFNASVAFSASGLPPGTTASFSSNSSSSGTTLTLNTTANTTPAGTYHVTVTGTSAGIAPASTTVVLVVAAAPAPSFTIDADDDTLRLTFGGLFGADTDIKVSRKNGFNSAVTFSVSGLPAGLVGSFSPVSTTSETELDLKKSLFASVASGTYTVTVRGTSGSLSATTTLSVVVTPFL